MAAQGGGMPTWMVNCKENITRSKEWNGFVGDLHDAVRQQLAESHVQSFTDLTDAERSLFLERAARAIRDGRPYDQLYKSISSNLEQHMNNEVAKQLMEDYPISTKSDLIVECAQDGIISLLRRWPGLRHKLHACLNQPLPTNLRQLAWKLVLDNSKVRKRYVDILNSKDIKKAISPQDLDISRKCEQLLMSEPTFEDVNGSVGAFYGMKAVLSYHHAMKQTREALPDVDYMLTVPLLQVATPAISRREPAPSKVVVLLVEQYFTLMESRHACMMDTGSQEDEDAWKTFSNKVAKHIQTKSLETGQALTKVYKPAEEKIVTTDAVTMEVVADGVRQLMRAAIRTLFVGYLNMDVILYIWDQYLIGMDSPGFHDDFLPVMAAVHLILLTDKLTTCQSPAAMETALKSESGKLTVPQFQYQVNRHFFQDLFSTLKQEDRAALPVLDPTQAKYPPWSNWHNEKIPSRTDAEDRRNARDAREAIRQKQLSQYKEQEHRRKEEQDKNNRAEQFKYIQEKEMTRERQDREKQHLEDQMQTERKRHIEAERDLQNEMERLRREMEDLKRSKLKSAGPSVWSMETGGSHVAGVLPPPATPASTWNDPTPTPHSRKSKTPTVHTPQQSDLAREPSQVMADVLDKFTNGFDQVVQGSGQ